MFYSMNNITIIDAGNVIGPDSNICFFSRDQTGTYNFRIINVGSGLQPINTSDNIIEYYNNILKYINVFSTYEVDKIVKILNSIKENNVEDLKKSVNEESKLYVIRDQYCGYYTKECRYIYDWETDKNKALQYTRGEASFIIKEIINNCKKDSKYKIIPLPVLFLEPV